MTEPRLCKLDWFNQSSLTARLKLKVNQEQLPEVSCRIKSQMPMLANAFGVKTRPPSASPLFWDQAKLTSPKRASVVEGDRSVTFAVQRVRSNGCLLRDIMKGALKP